MFNTYPVDERWRPMLCGALLVALLIPFLIPRVPYKKANAIGLFVVLPIIGFILLPGGWFGLRYVSTREWGGFMVTIILSYVGIVVSLPAGVLLALGRRSRLPVIKALCVVFIEMVRGVPLITVLFMATKMLPLFMPNNAKIDDFVCVLIGVALFASAYMAEVIRGGLQAVPKGQFEGADSLGLSYSQKMRLIVLPQALKLVIPGIVNTFIGLFKDTSLVYIVNMFDLLGAIRRNFTDANWITPQTPMTGLIFAGFVFWIFCFGMSRYSIYMERRLDTGYRR
jgi:general L-amino acid transport system permease protein